jgi:Rieske Fe-S protein
MVTRRNFVQACAALAASLHVQGRAHAARSARNYRRVRLVDGNERAIAPAQLAIGANYLFHYPYRTTPCFLLRLGTPTADGAELTTEDGGRYRWEGGVGPDHSVVAFSAICAHKLTHPAQAVSFISYRHQEVDYRDLDGTVERRAQVISCCSERSVYDATAGARVLGGPAAQPLAAIRLEHDPGADALYATGVYGGELFTRFFATFDYRLALEFDTTDIERPASGTATVTRLDEYSRRLVTC